MSVLDKLTAATSTRKSETICLDGALQAEWEAAFLTLEDAALEDEKATAGASMANATPHTSAVIEKLEDIRGRMTASEVTFVFEQVGWTSRLGIQAEHPPREGNLLDRIRGYNLATYTPAIIKASCIEVTDGTGDTVTDVPDEVWNSLLGWVDDDGTEHKGALNLKQVSALFEAASEVNDRETRIPISARSLLTSQDSGASLAQPSPGTSPRSGSAGGNRRTSRKSTATKKAASSGS